MTLALISFLAPWTSLRPCLGMTRLDASGAQPAHRLSGAIDGPDRPPSTVLRFIEWLAADCAPCGETLNVVLR